MAQDSNSVGLESRDLYFKQTSKVILMDVVFPLHSEKPWYWQLFLNLNQIRQKAFNK